MNNTLENWIRTDEITPRLNISQELAFHPGITVERLSDELTGDEGIKLIVDPSDSSWHQTSIGELRVAGIISTQTRNGERRSLTLEFQNDAQELLKHRSGGEYSINKIRSREIILDSNGVGWDELSRQYTDPDLLDQKPNGWQKFLIIDASIAENPQLQMRAAAD